MDKDGTPDGFQDKVRITAKIEGTDLSVTSNPLSIHVKTQDEFTKDRCYQPDSCKVFAPVENFMKYSSCYECAGSYDFYQASAITPCDSSKCCDHPEAIKPKG